MMLLFESAGQCRFDKEQKSVKQAGVVKHLFGWLVANGWCWFVLREEYCWLVAGGWCDVREMY
jgi:hypothetical protein